LLGVILIFVARRRARLGVTFRRKGIVLRALRLRRRLGDLERQDAFAGHLRSRRRVLLDYQTLL
jgi:hypothetical protein